MLILNPKKVLIPQPTEKIPYVVRKGTIIDTHVLREGAMFPRLPQFYSSEWAALREAQGVGDFYVLHFVRSAV